MDMGGEIIGGTEGVATAAEGVEEAVDVVEGPEKTIGGKKAITISLGVVDEVEIGEHTGMEVSLRTRQLVVLATEKCNKCR